MRSIPASSAFSPSTPPTGSHCQRNKLAVNWLVLRRQKGQAGFCHLGLFDMAEPLVIDGQVLGVFYFGSVLVKGRESLSKDRIQAYCRRHNVEPAPFLKLAELAPHIDPAKIPAYREFLRALAELASQCCLAAGARASGYQPRAHGIRYRPEDEMPYLIKSAMRYAKEHLSQPLGVKDIAAALRCHPNYLSKQFKKHVHIELSAYLSQLRIGHATQLMENPKLSISQVADASGFNDRVYFGKAFRRATGMTPGQYRQHLVDNGKFPGPSDSGWPQANRP